MSRSSIDFVEFVHHLTNVIPVWKKIATLQPGVESNQIPALRRKPRLRLHERHWAWSSSRQYRPRTVPRQHLQLEALCRPSWASSTGRKTAILWKNNLVRDGKIVNNQKLGAQTQPPQSADAIDWQPITGVVEETADAASSAPNWWR